jgi:glycosyltransferase involved in cell wall biosynthesis
VTLFACLTEFQRRRLTQEGYPAERLRVIPNVCAAETQRQIDPDREGEWVAYVGRISPEKGIDLLLWAAQRLRHIPFRLAGRYDGMPDLVEKAPANVSFLGNLEREPLADLYAGSRLVVLCSTCFEGFPMAVAEAMVQAKPVIASRLGGIPEIVGDGATGLLFPPGDAAALAEKIRYLWDHPDLGRQMGRAGRAKALQEYAPQKHYERLMTIYAEAMKWARRNTEGES